MLVIALTGGIASGKTLAADAFAELGVTVIDSDQLAREVVQVGTAALQEIIDHFGTDIVDDEGQLKRRKLRQIIFDAPTEKKWLEQCLHPRIRQLMATRIAAAQGDYCIVVIPLLFETSPNPLIDRILVIDTPEIIQLKRLQQRDALSQQQAQAMINTQASRQTRLENADDIIVNDKNCQHLIKEVGKIHQKFLLLNKQSN